MQLSDFFNQYAKETITQKTNIAIEVLNKLEAGEFGKYRHAQVLGYIKIIEREFGVDLDEFRDEISTYYKDNEENSQSSATINILDSDGSSDSSSSKLLGFVFTVATIGVISYGAWFLMNKDSSSNVYADTNSSAKSDKSKDDGMFSRTLDGAKNLFKGDDNKSKKITPETKTESSKKVALTTQESSVKVDTTTQNLSANSTITLAPDTASSNNVTGSDNKKFDIAPESDKKDDNKTTPETNSSSAVETTPIQELNSTTTSSATQEKIDTNIEQNSTLAAQDSNQSTEVSTTEATAITTAKIKAKKVWLGIYNLDTKKRTVKVAKGQYDLDLSAGKLAIVTGHSIFKLETDGQTKQFKGAKKSYLLISKEDGVKILTQNEYKKLTKRKAW